VNHTWQYGEDWNNLSAEETRDRYNDAVSQINELREVCEAYRKIYRYEAKR
jgi:hypothetical protein